MRGAIEECVVGVKDGVGNRSGRQNGGRWGSGYVAVSRAVKKDESEIVLCREGFWSGQQRRGR